MPSDAPLAVLTPTRAESRAAADRVRRARDAQRSWARRPLGERLRMVRRFRALLAENARRLADSAQPPGRRDRVETLTAEILPLAEACRFLENEAARILAPRRLPAARRPLWLRGTRIDLYREPLGLVLVIGPSNYPLFLPGAQALQALVAGNAVLLKPGRGGTDACRMLAELLRRAGLDPDLCPVLPEAAEAAQAAIELGVDKVVLTGRAATGREVLARLAPHLTPATMELSGCDAAFLLEGADLDLAARAIVFGMTLNGGATCIAPRCVLATEGLLRQLEPRLTAALDEAEAVEIDPSTAARVSAVLENAESLGATIVSGGVTESGALRPVVLAGVRPGMEILAADLFAPVLSLVAVDDSVHALTVAADSPYALGASVFGPPEAAAELAREIDAGVVVINDLIVPTADPRLPFGGRRTSGFGVTRGADGLLEMTRLKAVAGRRGSRRLHLEPLPDNAEELFEAYLEAAHTSAWPQRLRGVRRMLAAGRTAFLSRWRNRLS